MICELKPPESNGTSSIDFVGKAKHLLEPFLVEYLTISLGILFSLFNTTAMHTLDRVNNNTTDRCVLIQTGANDHDRPTMFGHPANAHSISVRVTATGQRVVKCSILIIALLFWLGYVTIYIVLSRHFQDDHEQNSQKYISYGKASESGCIFHNAC